MIDYLIKLFLGASLLSCAQARAGVLHLTSGNFKPLFGELDCDLSVKFNENTNKLYLTLIANQRTGNACNELGTNFIYKCEETGTCDGVNTEGQIEVTSELSFIRQVDNTSWIFSDNNSIKPPSKFTTESDYGFLSQTGKTFTGQNRCAFFFNNEGPRYVYCDDKIYAEQVFCPKVIKLASESVLKKCTQYYPSGCLVRTLATSKHSYIGIGEYEKSLQIYIYRYSSLFCRAKVMAMPK